MWVRKGVREQPLFSFSATKSEGFRSRALGEKNVMADIEQLVSTAKAQITTCDDLQQLEEIRTSYLGKKGALTAELKNLGRLSAEERPAPRQAHQHREAAGY